MIECPMCKNQVPELKSNSHVLPKFFLRSIRDPNGRINAVNVFKAIIDGRTQDLPKGTYICESCEDLTQKLDGYGAKVLKNPSGVGINIQAIRFGKIVFDHWDGINFQDFRDFLLSIAVRDHCWRISIGLQPIMTSNEFESVRSFLLSKDTSNDSAFPIVIHKIQPFLSVPRIHLSTSPPTISLPKDAITFMGLGFACMIYFKPPATKGMDKFNEIFRLKKDGTIKMPWAELFNIGTWKHSEKAIVDAYWKKHGKD